MTLLLILLVVLYIALLGGSLLALLATWWRPESFSRRSRYVLWALCLAELVYVLRSPAFIYLPWAPGAPAVRRFILGSDSQGRVYWLEAEEPLAFAMGPRWWFEFNVHAPPGRAGVEWIGPIRFARPGHRNVQVVRSDGLRKNVICPGSRLASRWPREVVGLTDGVFLLNLAGFYRLEAEEGACTFLASYQYRPDRPETEGLAAEGRPLRLEGVKKPAKSSSVADGRDKEMLPVASAIVLDPASGMELGLRNILVPFRGSREDVRSVEVARIFNGYYLLLGIRARGAQTRDAKTHKAKVYWLDPDLENARELAEVDTLPGKLIATSDGRFICTRDAIYTNNGRLVQTVWPWLDSGVWVGHRLVGVFESAFVGRAVLPAPRVPRHPFRSIEHQLQSPAARPASLNSPRGWQAVSLLSGKPDRWVLEGWDEAGGTDPIFSIAVELEDDPQ